MMSQPPAQGPLFPSERAFVVQFRAAATLAQGCWAGRVEHVVSGQATRFHTRDELLAFMAQVLTARSLVWDSDTPLPSAGSDTVPAALPPNPPGTSLP